MLPTLLEVEQRDGLQADVAVVGEREGPGEILVQDQVVIPLLDSELRGFDGAAVIDLDLAARPARFREGALGGEERLAGCDFVVAG